MTFRANLLKMYPAHKIFFLLIDWNHWNLTNIWAWIWSGQTFSESDCGILALFLSLCLPHSYRQAPVWHPSGCHCFGDVPAARVSHYARVWQARNRTALERHTRKKKLFCFDQLENDKVLSNVVAKIVLIAVPKRPVHGNLKCGYE